MVLSLPNILQKFTGEFQWILGTLGWTQQMTKTNSASDLIQGPPFCQIAYPVATDDITGSFK